MANSYFYNQQFSKQQALTFLEAHCDIGSSGAVSNVQGGGIANITKIATGTYQIQLKDSYYRFMGLSATTKAPVTGSAVAAASLSAGTVYEIVSVGTTDFNAVGLPSGQTAAAGQIFVATGAGTGTGTAKALAATSAKEVQVLGDPNVMINQNTPTIVVQLTAPTSSSDTTPVPTNPASGSKLHFEICLRNSTRTPNGQSE